MSKQELLKQLEKLYWYLMYVAMKMLVAIKEKIEQTEKEIKVENQRNL